MDTPLQSILNQLEPEHARALEWFLEHEGEVGARPWRVHGESVVPGVRVPLVAQRGIHQPSGWNLALSITATRASVYLDGVPESIDAETWVLPYRAHEGGDGVGAESRWNRALMRNLLERVPVGVFVPEDGKYRNLGLAIVESYDPGSSTFLLRGPMRLAQAEGTWTEPVTDSRPSADLDEAVLLSMVQETADPAAYSLVRRRVAQDRFRDRLVSAYQGKCAVTGYDALDALQGAHILAYSGRSSQLAANGLLLRADVHLLFDRHLLSIEPDSRRLRLARPLLSTAYAELDRKRIAPPARDSDAPDAHRLAVHWAVFERAAGM